MRISNLLKRSLMQVSDVYSDSICSGFYNIGLKVSYVRGRLFWPVRIPMNFLPTVNLQLQEGQTMVFPLPQEVRLIYKTSDRILNQACRSGKFNYHIDTGKGYGYIAGTGYILKEDGSPLIIICHDIDTDILNTSKYICIVHPQVFESNDIISTAIVKKVIPFYSCYNKEVDVLISDEIEHMVYKVEAKDNPENIDRDIYEILYTYEDEL